jgi:hypothetical protein
MAPDRRRTMTRAAETSARTAREDRHRARPPLGYRMRYAARDDAVADRMYACFAREIGGPLGATLTHDDDGICVDELLGTRHGVPCHHAAGHDRHGGEEAADLHVRAAEPRKELVAAFRRDRGCECTAGCQNRDPANPEAIASSTALTDGHHPKPSSTTSTRFAS